MSYLPSLLHPATLAAATLTLTFTPFLSGTTTVASVATVTAVTVLTAGQAEAKPRPKSQRGLGNTTVMTSTSNAR